MSRSSARAANPCAIASCGGSCEWRASAPSRLDRSRATASIRHDAGPRGAAPVPRAALRRDPGRGLDRVDPGHAASDPRGDLHHPSPRFAADDLRGRVRSARPSAPPPRALRRDPPLARGVEQRLVGASGRHPGDRRPLDGEPVDRLRARRVADSPGSSGWSKMILDDSSGWGSALPEPTRTRFGSANTTLGIAAAGQFLVPVLVPVSAVLLVGTNVRTFRYAWLQVRGGHFGLPVLYTAIVAATLASGQFLASALMYWFFTFWHGRLRIELAGERRRLLDECLPRPSFTSPDHSRGGRGAGPGRSAPAGRSGRGGGRRDGPGRRPGDRRRGDRRRAERARAPRGLAEAGRATRCWPARPCWPARCASR